MEKTPHIESSRVGYVAVIGRPNAGKSTLINALIGEHVSAVSSRPQTTQRSIRAILTDPDRKMQIIFLDTPWIHEVDTRIGSSPSINERINSEAFAALRNADVILRLVDPTRPQGKEDARIDEVLSFLETPVIRIETKQDLPKSFPGKNIDVRINATDGAGFDALLDALLPLLPEWPYLYEEDFYTDQTVDFRVSEAIRETLFSVLSEEIPYATYIEITQMDHTAELLSVHAYIHTETESQKRIVIGKWGKQIAEIGMRSRMVLEGIFGKRVFLSLRVKVDKNWRKNTKILERLFPKR